jgi:hypothetical protein
VPVKGGFRVMAENTFGKSRNLDSRKQKRRENAEKLKCQNWERRTTRDAGRGGPATRCFGAWKGQNAGGGSMSLGFLRGLVVQDISAGG